MTRVTNLNPGRITGRRLLFIAVAAGVCAMLFAAIGFNAPPRAIAASNTLIGTTGNGNPSCPIGPSNDPSCYVMAQITGFQNKVKKRKNPFKAKRDGKIVSWSVKLGKPTKTHRKRGAEVYGTRALGGNPIARIVVLAKVPNKKNQFRLVRQSPWVRLNQHYGSTPVFTLNDPLTIKRGQIVGITALTWVPNLTTYQRVKNSQWRASANNKNQNCRKASSSNQRQRAQYKHNPQKKVGSKRAYACKFGDLLLYSARIVPTTTGGNTGNAETAVDIANPAAAPAAPTEVIELSGE